MPLPGVTPAQVVSQLAHRIFGPLRPTRTQIVLDYHGLLTQPAARAADIARRHHITAPTVSNNVAVIRAAGARQPLSPQIVTEAERPSTPQDDHLARVRIATTLGLAPPAPAPAGNYPPVAGNAGPEPRLAAARVGVRILAAAGPLPLPAVTAALARSRRFRARPPLPDSDLAAALTATGCTIDDADQWHPPAGAVPAARDQVIVTMAAGQELTRQQMIGILTAAGYSKISAEGRMSTSHPLFQHTGPDRYRIIGDPPTVGAGRATRPGGDC